MSARFLRRTLAGLLAAVAPAAAADPFAADRELTHAARAALAADPQTARVTLLISVVDGGLVAGGPVPSDAVAARVGEVLRGVRGVRSVAVSCWVPAAAADPLTAAVRERLARPPAPPPDRLTAASTTALRFVPLLGEPAAPRPAAGYSPLPPPAPPPPPGPPQYPTIRPPAVPVVPGQDVPAAVDEVRRADARFAGLTATVSGGVVVVGGRSADPGDVWALAAAVRRVPGVERVVVQPSTEY